MTNISGSNNKVAVIVVIVVLVSAAAFSVMILNIPFDSIDQDGQSPIRDIDEALHLIGDDELLTYVSNHSLNGIGTSDDPYIIENLSIVENGNCIDIRNIESAFVIRNCELKSTLDFAGIALYLSNCQSVTVERCRMEGGISGIEIFQCNDAIVKECLTRFTFFGINSSLSQRVSILNNRISNVTWGIAVVGSNATNIENNTIYHTEYGVISQFSFNCSVTYCNITDNQIGVMLELVCLYWMIHSNIFARNVQHNARDDGESNMWDNGVDFGNYWDDFLGVGIYSIPGVAGSIDRYPQGL